MNNNVKPLFFYFSIGIASVTALLTGLTFQAFWPDWRWHDEPLHSTIETLGGLAAIAMALVLWQSTEVAGRNKRLPVAVGFLGMGILEIFHAISIPGNGFVLLRGVASLVGGFGFALVWLQSSADDKGPAWLWLGSAGTLAFGVGTLVFPEQLPVMIRQGQFAPAAIALKGIACIFFLVAAGRFFLDYHRSARSEDFLLACLALMFGLAELMFTYSTIWDGPWWFWHWLRLMAYLLVLAYVVRGYLGAVSDLRNSLAQTKQAEETVRRSERQLRKVMEERERLAQDLHDGAIQSIFALGLTLERFQRLIPKDPAEAIRKVGGVIADLKLVSRDLRNFISRTEPESEKTPSLDEAIASLVGTMNRSAPFSFRLQVDPTATLLLTPTEAADVLFILKEAMSNSLRHARARSGSVSLQKQNGRVRLEVEDDGQGFDPGDIQDPGNGLRNMAARAERHGARFEVLSAQETGTRIIFEIHKKGDHVSPSV